MPPASKKSKKAAKKEKEQEIEENGSLNLEDSQSDVEQEVVLDDQVEEGSEQGEETEPEQGSESEAPEEPEVADEPPAKKSKKSKAKARPGPASKTKKKAATPKQAKPVKAGERVSSRAQLMAVKNAERDAERAAKEKEEENAEYEVDFIVDSRKKKGTREFLIKWKGYRHNHNTWEAEEKLNCPEKIEEYLKKESERTDESDDAEYEVERIEGVRGTKKGQRKFLVKWKGYGKQHNSWESEANLKCAKAIKDFERSVRPDSDEEYEVETIVDVKGTKKGSRQFLIKWKGCSKSQNTWEPEANLNCPKAIKEFEEKQLQVESDDDEYEVERIVDVRSKGSRAREFLIKWKGFPASQNTWELESKLNCADAIKEFEKKQKSLTNGASTSEASTSAKAKASAKPRGRARR